MEHALVLNKGETGVASEAGSSLFSEGLAEGVSFNALVEVQIVSIVALDAYPSSGIVAHTVLNCRAGNDRGQFACIRLG